MGRVRRDICRWRHRDENRRHEDHGGGHHELDRGRPSDTTSADLVAECRPHPAPVVEARPRDDGEHGELDEQRTPVGALPQLGDGAEMQPGGEDSGGRDQPGEEQRDRREGVDELGYQRSALGGVLDAAWIPTLRCRAVAGAANNQLAEPADAERLRERGILYAPDFVINAGGAIAITGQEALGWPAEKAEAAVLAIGDTLARVYELAEAEGISTDAAARRIAEKRLKK